MNQIPNFQRQKIMQLTISNSQANSSIPKMIKHTKTIKWNPKKNIKIFQKTKHKPHFTFKKQNLNAN